MFHVETQNVMYVNAEGQHFLNEGMVDGKRWYILTADYAFGHDLLAAARAFLDRNNGEIAGEDLVPTDATDFSAFMLKIREAEPDLVALNLAGTQITSFFKQYGEFGLDFPVGGFGFDTASAWAAGAQNFRGTWPNVWNHLLDIPASREFAASFTEKYGKPPENQAWGDYMALYIVKQAFEEAGGTDSAAVIGISNPTQIRLLKDGRDISTRTTSCCRTSMRSPRSRRMRSRTSGISSPRRARFWPRISRSRIC